MILAAITWEQEGAGEIQPGNATEHSSVHKRTWVEWRAFISPLKRLSWQAGFWRSHWQTRLSGRSGTVPSLAPLGHISTQTWLRFQFNFISLIERQNITHVSWHFTERLDIQREPSEYRAEENPPRIGDTYRKKPRADPRLKGPDPSAWGQLQGSTVCTHDKLIG